MSYEELPLEYRKSLDRLQKQDARIERQSGFGETTEGMALTRRYIQPLTDAFKARLEEKADGRHYDRPLLLVLQDLSPTILALSSLQTALHSVATESGFRSVLLAQGASLMSECWGARLTQDNPYLASRVARAIKGRTSGMKQRRQAARSAAARAGFAQKRWPRSLQLSAGRWSIETLLATLPDIFEWVDGKEERFLTITEGGFQLAAEAVGVAVANTPMWLPTALPPQPWKGWNDGGAYDPRVRHSATLLRSPYKDTASAVRHGIKTGEAQPALDALNALQAVAWTINRSVLDVMQQCIAQKIEVKGLPRFTDLLVPALPKPRDEMSEPEMKLWKYRASETRRANRGFIGERLLLEEDMQTALRMVEHERFYTPMNMDWRGRVYGLCHFNFQREDRVRGLFMFAEGEPLGDDGLYWLKVHTANCGDFDKISKRPLDERIAWIDEHLDEILAMVAWPMGRAHQWWRDADKPFLFLAACMELAQAWAIGSTFVTRLPCSFDGSCSGLQHLCAMTRAEEGSKVNLTPSPLPQDVYETVAEVARARIAADTEKPHMAKACLDFGVNRGLVKRNVMTYSYSSKKFGMAMQHLEDTMKPLEFDVLQGKLEEHPFGYDNGYSASKYIAHHVFDAIEEVVKLPAQAMGFLQSCARALAHESKPLRWVSPVGLPWINRYHEPTTSRVTLYLADKGVKVRTQVVLAEGHAPEIDKSKAASGVAPNFVHANDASHLLLVARAAAREGITQMATVHDSFGCLANRARRFNEIIREQFVEMYQTHDVLSEVLEQAKRDLTQANWHKLPELPEYGSLNIEDVKNATYAFA